MSPIPNKVGISLMLICFSIWCGVTTAQNNSCSRTCVQGESPMTCEYQFKIEDYYSMSRACYSCPFTVEDCAREDCIPAGGVQRSLITVNRQMPGPSIEVCEGDLIVVHLTNALFSDSTTIHWHGQHQLATPYMDGVPQATQCPILPGDTFTYRFTATQAGTHFWHSHSGLQRGDGVFGMFVVRQPAEENPHVSLYDYDLPEHQMIVNDWIGEGGLEKFLKHYHNDGDNFPTSILINGKGRAEELTNDAGETTHVPLERFYVEQGFKYRFRVVNNGVLICPIQISVDNHNITVIY